MARTGRCLCGFVRYEIEGTLGPVVHVNVESKSGWYDILDGLPQHAALPPEARRAIDAADQ